MSHLVAPSPAQAPPEAAGPITGTNLAIGAFKNPNFEYTSERAARKPRVKVGVKLGFAGELASLEGGVAATMHRRT